MSQSELLARITRQLEDAAIPYMIVGSLASSFHGEPRMTRDIDIVIDPDAATLQRLIEALHGLDLYVDPDAALDALDRRTSFNAIEADTGWKVDFLVRKDRAFSRTELERRIRARLLNTDTHVATAEDTIVAKLEWAMRGESERQLRDVVSMLDVNGEALDFAYIEHWVQALNLSEQWKRAQEVARA
jgi:hypothetical protein